MGYTLRTKDSASDLGRAADQNQSVDNDILFNGQHADIVTAWDCDKPPASAGSIDDEFENSSLSGNWTEYDPDGKTTWTEGAGGLLGTTTSVAAGSMNGIYQTLPAGDFSITVKIGIAHLETATVLFGIDFWENPAGDNKQAIYGMLRDATGIGCLRIYCQEYTNRTTDGTVKLALLTVGDGDHLYLRIRRNGTNYYLDYSWNGWIWRTPNANAAITLSFTPTKVGIGINNKNTGVTVYERAQFFRYVASDLGLQGMLTGARG